MKTFGYVEVNADKVYDLSRQIIDHIKKLRREAFDELLEQHNAKVLKSWRFKLGWIKPATREEWLKHVKWLPLRKQPKWLHYEQWEKAHELFAATLYAKDNEITNITLSTETVQWMVAFKYESLIDLFDHDEYLL